VSKQNNYSVMRHSAAHLLAHAISELFPDVLFTIGPATKEGFFYDVLPKNNFKESDLALLEEKMHEIAKRSLQISHTAIDKKTAQKLFAHNRFKLELIDGIEGETVGLAKQGDFIDLCKGGHVENTDQIKYFELTGLSGSYWRADRNNQVLQRISGTAFLTQQDFDAHKQQRAQAELYDHRRLGKILDLFSFQDEGPGFPFYHPKGKAILNILVDHLKKFLHLYEYQEISTPIMLSDDLWKRSGHYDFYKEHMYFSTVDEQTYAVRPMNCPGAILVYQDRPRSYRELPLRLAEFALDHRYELSGAMHGLFRARAFTQDDAHIFCRSDLLGNELQSTIRLWSDVWKKFDFKDVFVKVATRPEKALGAVELWSTAIQALEDALQQEGYRYEIAPGEGAFYGPKIEFHIKDSMDRSWQCGTIQVDFAQPENFNLSYIADNGMKERPVIIHRAIYGSLERFFAILLEHYKGKLPFWLAPIQISILTITDEQKAYSRNLYKILHNSGVRVTLDESSDPIQGKIKTSVEQAIPWALIIGKREAENETVSIRLADGTQKNGLIMQALLDLIHNHN
jgi:threonyl-tRNA synthetase